MISNFIAFKILYFPSFLAFNWLSQYFKTITVSYLIYYTKKCLQLFMVDFTFFVWIACFYMSFLLNSCLSVMCSLVFWSFCLFGVFFVFCFLVFCFPFYVVVYLLNLFCFFVLFSLVWGISPGVFMMFI